MPKRTSLVDKLVGSRPSGSLTPYCNRNTGSCTTYHRQKLYHHAIISTNACMILCLPGAPVAAVVQNCCKSIAHKADGVHGAVVTVRTNV